VIVADSGVWIDFFRGEPNRASDELNRLLASGTIPLLVPDLVLFEVLRGFREEKHHRSARKLLESVGVVDTGGAALALAAADHYRALRQSGVTPRSAIDVLLAAFCIEEDFLILHRDRDFEPFETLRGLRVWHH
jgi:predicted nucleic acid-binding protein